MIQKVALIGKRLRTVLTDLRYGAMLKGKIASKYSHLGATDTENSDYSVLGDVFLNQVRPTDVLVDVGRGNPALLQGPDHAIRSSTGMPFRPLSSAVRNH